MLSRSAEQNSSVLLLTFFLPMFKRSSETRIEKNTPFNIRDTSTLWLLAP